MKKRILGLALIAMSMAAIGANAQTNSNCPNDNSNCTKTECTRSQKCGKGDAYKLRSNAVFDKMNLSADQKAKLQALKQKKAEARKAAAEARKAQKQRGNTEARASREAEKKQYLQDLKAIIGPDNYVIFLEDYYVQDNPGKCVRASSDTKNCMKADRSKNRKDGNRRAGSAAGQNANS